VARPGNTDPKRIILNPSKHFFFQFFDFIRTSAHPHIRTSAHPHIRTSAHPHIRTSTSPKHFFRIPFDFHPHIRTFAYWHIKRASANKKS
jgi:hypothetical protein